MNKPKFGGIIVKTVPFETRPFIPSIFPRFSYFYR